MTYIIIYLIAFTIWIVRCRKKALLVDENENIIHQNK